jgi:stage II sporulation protein P
VILSLLLRLLAGIPVLEEVGIGEILMYLHTGYPVRHPTVALRPTEPPIPTQIPQQPAPTPGELPLKLDASGAQRVQLHDLVDYDPDIPALYHTPLSWDLHGAQPKVLILHTHATESYTMGSGEEYEASSLYRTLDADYNMLSIGAELARILEKNGLSVLHDRVLHDFPSYSGSYAAARRSIAAYLEAYPGICMVIDLHRDALDLEKEPQLTTLATVNGEKSAQLMLVAGTDANQEYPGWEENLALGVKLTAVLERMYPGITRPIQLRAQRFNLDMTPGSLLVEVGASGNTQAEALRAVRALGTAIVALSRGTVAQ